MSEVKHQALLAESNAIAKETYWWQIELSFATSNDTTQHRDCSHLCITFARRASGFLTHGADWVKSLFSGPIPILSVQCEINAFNVLSRLLLRALRVRTLSLSGMPQEVELDT